MYILTQRGFAETVPFGAEGLDYRGRFDSLRVLPLDATDLGLSKLRHGPLGIMLSIDGQARMFQAAWGIQTRYHETASERSK